MRHKILGQVRRSGGQLTAWAVSHPALALLIAVSLAAVSLLVAVRYLRSRRRSADLTGQVKKPLSKRLLPLSIICTTGMSAQGMWTVATNALHQHGVIRVALFAFAEIALLSAASSAQESLVKLRELLASPPDGDAPEADRALYAADKAAATRSARLFTYLVWLIAVGAGLAAQSIATDATERGVRMFPALLVAAFWYAQLDRSGLAVTRESITSRVSYKRLMVFLRIADPGTIGLAESDRNTRLNRLVKALHRYHRIKGLREGNKVAEYRLTWADYRLDRAERGANKHLDPAGREYVAERLTVRYTLRNQTSPAALSAANPWAVSGQLYADSLTASVRSGQVETGQLTGQAVRSGSDRSGQVSSNLTGQVSSAKDARSMAEFIQGWMEDEVKAGRLKAGQIPGRGRVQPVLRERFDGCSTDLARAVVLLIREMLAQSSEAS